MLDRHDLGVLRSRSARHRNQRLTGRIRDQVEMKIAGGLRHITDGQPVDDWGEGHGFPPA
jgi:hypothetical protein